jgi:hypothetical protein
MENKVRVRLKYGFTHTVSDGYQNIYYKAGDILFLHEEELNIVGWKFERLAPPDLIAEMDIQEIEPEPDSVADLEIQEIELDSDEESGSKEEVDVPLERLNIGHPVRSRLLAAGIGTAKELLDADTERVLKIKGIGVKTLERVIRDARAALGR